MQELILINFGGDALRGNLELVSRVSLYTLLSNERATYGFAGHIWQRVLIRQEVP